MCHRVFVGFMENRAYFEVGFQDTERSFYFADGIIDFPERYFIDVFFGSSQEIYTFFFAGSGNYPFPCHTCCLFPVMFHLDVEKPVCAGVFLFQPPDAFPHFLNNLCTALLLYPFQYLVQPGFKMGCAPRVYGQPAFLQ